MKERKRIREIQFVFIFRREKMEGTTGITIRPKKPRRKKRKSRVKEFIDYAIYLFFG